MNLSGILRSPSKSVSILASFQSPRANGSAARSEKGEEKKEETKEIYLDQRPKSFVGMRKIFNKSMYERARVYVFVCVSVSGVTEKKRRKKKEKKREKERERERERQRQGERK